MDTPTPSEPISTSGIPMYFNPEVGAWKKLGAKGVTGNSSPGEEKLLSAAKDELKGFLLSSLQMQHVVVLAGNGTSLGPDTKGPSMSKLWDSCVNSNPGSGGEERTISPTAARVIAQVEYQVTIENENVEALISRCEAFLQIKESTEVSEFITTSKRAILENCSQFLDLADDKQLAAHRTFLHRLSRRRARDSRLKVFTTNYDVCFEAAAGRQGLVALDGFSFTQPRRFDPRFFLYDIVRRPTTGDEVGTPLEGVFHLYKLHGSVNWSRNDEGEVEIVEKPPPERACLIYPASGKYRQSYAQPHLELVSQYFSTLREPNTCLIVVGFGFNDDHLSEPILAAVRTNPYLRLIIVNPSADDVTARPTQRNRYWESLFKLAMQGEDVWLINASFGDFAELIPDLKSLTPAQRLTRDIRQMTDTK